MTRIIDRMLARLFGDHAGKRVQPTSLAVQLFGGFGPLRFQP